MSDLSLSKIENMIYIIRDQMVMIDSDLDELNGVPISKLASSKYILKIVDKN